jgi:hypothetical protein
LYGKAQIVMQCIFWLLSIYICNFSLIFECFNDSVIQFVILFFCVYHQICALRSFYNCISINTAVSPISNEEKEKNCGLITTECKKCGIIRPIRSHHCSICNKCIDKLDHHCFLLNKCIGKKNYKFFLSYLFLSLINSIIAIAFGIYHLYLFKQKEMAKLKEMVYIEFNLGFIFNFPIKTVLLLLICFPTCIGSSYLLSYHLFLIYKNQTTIERKYPKLYIEDKKKESQFFCEKLSKALENDNWLNVYWLE